MGKKLRPLDITAKKLSAGEFVDILPEYYDLALVSETNPWHDDQNVFEHVVAVFSGLESILKLNFLKPKEKKAIESYLGKKAGKYCRKELLIVAILLHDIAKSYLHIKLDSGKTEYPGHAMIGASSVSQFRDRFDLDSKGAKYVQRLVHFHGFVNDVLTLLIHGKDLEKALKMFEAVVGDIQIELLLFMYADMKGSDLKKLDSKEYRLRETAIIRSLAFLTGRN